jgi:hypothetical protein
MAVLRVPFALAGGDDCEIYRDKTRYSVDEVRFDGSRVCGSPKMLQFLRKLADKVGAPLKLTWGVRSSLMQKAACLKMCLRLSCPGRCSENSGHTDGIAVDISTPYGADKICPIMDEIRSSVFGGGGGIGNYGSTISHVEISSVKCNLSSCRDALGLNPSGRECPSDYESARAAEFMKGKGY